MKKLLALALTGAMALTLLAGCGGSGGGCNAGMAVLALLSFAPLALRRRR